MRDVKEFHNLAGDEYWPFVPFVEVKGAVSAQRIPKDASQSQGEEVVKSWQHIAVLEVSPDTEVFFGFKVGDHAQFMNVPVETDNGLFGARVGDGDVSFFVTPKDLKSRPTLRLVEVTSIDDPKYDTLPMY